MNPTVSDVYELTLASCGKLKLRAKSLLAGGSDEEVFEACVLLHEAARVQRRAMKGLPACPPATRLSSCVEECWCYVEGLDPPRAAEAWGQVLLARQEVDEHTAEEIVSRIAPRFEASQRQFANAVKPSRVLSATRHDGSLPISSAIERESVHAELATVLSTFPGATSLWWKRYRLAEASKRKKEAWDALTRARRLEPENPRFLAMSLLTAAWALPRTEADRYLAPVRGVFERSGAEVCLMYAFSEIALARRALEKEQTLRWRRALDAAQAGLTQVESEWLRKILKAVQMSLQALLAGRKPTMDILYLAGLGELALAARPDADVTELLTASALDAA